MIKQPSWKLRRRAVFSSLIFGFILITYIALFGESNSLNETLALGAFGLIGAVVAAYIGGAAYQDVKLWKDISLYDKQTSDLSDDEFDDTIDTESDNERNNNVH